MKALNIIVLLAGLFAAVNSYAAGTVLMEKHGAAWPQSQNGYATKYQCMKCHGDYKNLAQKTPLPTLTILTWAKLTALNATNLTRQSRT